MLTVEKKKKYTAADYMMLEEGAPFQLINNELVMSPSPNSVHQAIVVRLGKVMLIFLENREMGGYAAGSMDVVFDESNIFQPDFLYVSEDRRKEIVRDRVEGAPDMVIEILSPSNAIYDLRIKKEIYQKYGVKEYIILDPIAKNAQLFTLDKGTYRLHQTAHLQETLRSIILPGFSFDLSYLFM